MANVEGSGTRIMSDSLMLVNPRIELPSRGNPVTKASSVISSAGTLN